MLNYRSHVYSLAMAAIAEAANLAVLFSQLPQPPTKNGCSEYELKRDSYNREIEKAKAELQSGRYRLEIKIKDLKKSLPKEVRDDIENNITLGRHLGFLGRNLDQGKVHQNLASDPVDIAIQDIPKVMECFDSWYYRQSPAGSEMSEKLNRHISDGDLNTALREAWPIFKTRMVAKFGIDKSLDGHKLAEQLFGPGDVTAEIFSEDVRRGYLNLFKGLYTLYRNEITHNDIQFSTAEVEATLALISFALVKIDNGHS